MIFPTYNFDEVQPGNTEEEVAQNIEALLTLLGGQVLDMDLSFIDAKQVVNKDLKHMQNFLQLLMDVVVLIAENQEEEEEEPNSSAKKNNKESKQNENRGDSAPNPPDPEDETDTQKLADDMGIYMGDEMSPDAQFEMADEAEPPKPKLDDDHDAKGHFAPLDLGEPESEKKESPKKYDPVHEPIDVFNDPLLPDDMNPKRTSEKKKKGRSGSFGGGDEKGGFDDDEMDVAYDDLNDEEKQYLLEQLWEEYQRDPDNFPEEQWQLLEQEIHKFMDPNQFEDDMEDELDDERMKIEGNINFPKDPLPMRKGDDEDTSPQLEIDDGLNDEKEDEDEKYMKQLMEQQEKDKWDWEKEEHKLMQRQAEEANAQDDMDEEPQQPMQYNQDEMDIQDNQPQQQPQNDYQQQEQDDDEAYEEIQEDEEDAPQFEEDQLAQLQHQQMLMQQMAMQN